MIKKREKDIRDEKWFKNYIKNLFKNMTIGSSWISEFAIFERTGEREMTLKVRISSPHADTAACIERVKGIVEEMGWTYVVAKDVKDAGVVN